MSSHSTMSAGDRARTTTDDLAERSGWATFAGVMLAIVGALNVVYGIAAIDSANFYVNNAQYVVSDLNAYGWTLLIVGAIQFCAAFSIFAGTSWGRWVGVFSAGVNSIAQLLFLPAYPALALALFAIDILIIYGLVAHGGRHTFEA
jgi:hypothetical protein